MFKKQPTGRQINEGEKFLVRNGDFFFRIITIDHVTPMLAKSEGRFFYRNLTEDEELESYGWVKIHSYQLLTRPVYHEYAVNFLIEKISENLEEMNFRKLKMIAEIMGITTP